MSANQGGYGGGFGPPGGQPPGGFGQPQQPGFGQPQQPGFGQPPAGAYGPPPGGPPGGGFGDPNASQGSVGEVFSNFGLLAKRSLSGIAWVFVLFALVSFLFGTIPQSLVRTLRIQVLNSSDPIVSFVIITLLGYGLSLLAVLIGIIISTLQAGLARAARVALVDGVDALGGFGGVLRLSYARFWHVLGCNLLLALGILIGLVFCILPGIIVLYFGMAGAYLCASKDEGPWNALVHSFRLTTKYSAPASSSCSWSSWLGASWWESASE